MIQYPEPTADAIDAFLAEHHPAWTLVRDEPLFHPKMDRGNGIRRINVGNGQRVLAITIFFDRNGTVTDCLNPDRRAKSLDEMKALLDGTAEPRKKRTKAEPSERKRWSKPWNLHTKAKA